MQKVWSARRGSRSSLAAGRQMYPEASSRPVTTQECDEQHPDMGTPGEPCPFVSCIYNLAIDVNERTGSYAINVPFSFEDGDPVPDIEISPGAHTCARKAALDGPLTMESIGESIGVSRERVRQIVDTALNKLSLDAQNKRHLPIAMELVGIEPMRPVQQPQRGQTWRRRSDGVLVLIEQGADEQGMLIRRFFSSGLLHRTRDRLTAFLRTHEPSSQEIALPIIRQMMERKPDRSFDINSKRSASAA